MQTQQIDLFEAKGMIVPFILNLEKLALALVKGTIDT